MSCHLWASCITAVEDGYARPTFRGWAPLTARGRPSSTPRLACRVEDRDYGGVRRFNVKGGEGFRGTLLAEDTERTCPQLQV